MYKKSKIQITKKDSNYTHIDRKKKMKHMHI